MEENNFTTENSLLNIARDTLIYLPSKLFPSLLGIISLSLYTRIFSAKEYGDYSLFISTTSILIIFTSSWINSSNLRFFSEYKNKNQLKLFYSTSFFLLIMVTFLISITTLAFSKLLLLPYFISERLFLFLAYLITITFFNTITAILRADRKTKLGSALTSLSSLSSLTISIFLIYFLNLGISAIIVGFVVTYLTLSSYSFFRQHYQVYISPKSFSKTVAKEFIQYGYPLISTLLFSWILMMSDRYMLAYFRGSYEVGIYSAIYQLADYPLSMVSSIILMSSFPIIIDTWKESSPQETSNLIALLTKYYLLLSVPMLYGMTALSSEFTQVLGQTYSTGHNVIPWIGFGSLMNGLCLYTNKGFELSKKTSILSYIIGIAGLINIILNFILIPKYGYYGAGVATTISYTTFYIISLNCSKKYLDLTMPVRSLLNIVICSSIMYFTLFEMKIYLKESVLNLVLLVIIGMFIYFITLLIIGEIKNETGYVNKIVKRLLRRIDGEE